MPLQITPQLLAMLMQSSARNPMMAAAQPQAQAPTPGMLAAMRAAPSNPNNAGTLAAGIIGNIGGRLVAPALLSGIGSATGLGAGLAGGLGSLATGTGVAAALGLSGGLTGALAGSIIPGIGTLFGAGLGLLAPSLFKTNAPALNDIQGAMNKGTPASSISPQSWSQAGYAPGGNYLNAAELESIAPGSSKYNASPLRDITGALYAGRPISNGSWSQAGLPSGGGAYGQALQTEVSDINNPQSPLYGLKYSYNPATGGFVQSGGSPHDTTYINGLLLAENNPGSSASQALLQGLV